MHAALCLLLFVFQILSAGGGVMCLYMNSVRSLFSQYSGLDESSDAHVSVQTHGDVDERVIYLFSIMSPTSAVWIDDVVAADKVKEHLEYHYQSSHVHLVHLVEFWSVFCPSSRYNINTLNITQPYILIILSRLSSVLSYICCFSAFCLVCN